jgi:hypothetical protein
MFKNFDTRLYSRYYYSIENYSDLLKPSEIKSLTALKGTTPKMNGKGWTVSKRKKSKFLQDVDRSLQKLITRQKRLIAHVCQFIMARIKEKRRRLESLPRKYFDKWRNFCGYEKRWTNHGCDCNRVWVSCNGDCREQSYWTKK